MFWIGIVTNLGDQQIKFKKKNTFEFFSNEIIVQRESILFKLSSKWLAYEKVISVKQIISNI